MTRVEAFFENLLYLKISRSRLSFLWLDTEGTKIIIIIIIIIVIIIIIIIIITIIIKYAAY